MKIEIHTMGKYIVITSRPITSKIIFSTRYLPDMKLTGVWVPGIFISWRPE